VPSILNGSQIPQTARHQFTGTTNVELFHGFEIGGSALYTSRQYGNISDNRTAVQNAGGLVTVNPATKVIYRSIPGYWRFDARASYAVNDHLELSVNAQNVFDKQYFSALFTNHYATIAPGRTVFGTVGVKF
jgi:catecholate siderophore receptor